MSDFNKGWYGKDDDGYWEYIGNDDELAEHILELDCGKDFVDSLVIKNFDQTTGTTELIEDVMAYAYENKDKYDLESAIHNYYKEIILFNLYSSDYDYDCDIFVEDEHNDCTHQFRFADCDEDLDIY